MAPKNDTEAEELAPLRAPEGGTAFPGTRLSESDSREGMSLRDYFAAAALTGLVQKCAEAADAAVAAKGIVEDAYTLADAMLAERSRR